METIFTLGDEGSDEKVKLNLDELYEHKKQYDLNTLALYNRILGRIHTRIKNVSRQHVKEQHCWYVVPEIIIGIPKYDNAACIAYVIDQLRENGLMVRYTHPNLLLISWSSYCPTYVRAEIKKKTGIIVDDQGKRLDLDNSQLPAYVSSSTSSISDTNELMFSSKKPGGHGSGAAAQKEYKDISSYKPTGLIYNQSLLKTIEDKTRW